MSLTVYLNGSGTIKNGKCCKTLTFSSVVITDSAAETMTPQQFVEYGQSLPCNPCGSVMVNCKKYNLKITNSKIVNNKLVLWLSKNCKLPTGYCKSVKVTMLPCCESDSVLYGIKFTDYDTSPVATLVTIDQTTGQVNDVGNTNTYISSIAYDKCTKTLYGIAYDLNNYDIKLNFRLVKIDKSTAKVTNIGPTGFPLKQFTINNSGKMYGYAVYYEINPYTIIDKNTGHASAQNVPQFIENNNASSIYSTKDDELLLFITSNFEIYVEPGVYKYKDNSLQFLQPYNGDNGDFKPCTNNYYGIFRGAETPQNDNVIAIIDLVTGKQSMLTLTGLKEGEVISSLTFV